MEIVKAKCKECPFYFPDENNVDNSCCRYGGGWGWGLKPDQDCYFGRTLNELKRLFKINEIRW